MVRKYAIISAMFAILFVMSLLLTLFEATVSSF